MMGNCIKDLFYILQMCTKKSFLRFLIKHYDPVISVLVKY